MTQLDCYAHRGFAIWAAAMALALGVNSRPGRAESPVAPQSTVAPLSLSRAETLVLENNPNVPAMMAAMRAADARTDQAGARPNPSTVFETENVGLDYAGRGEAEITLSIAQPIEVGTKRSLRIREADALRTVTQHEREQVLLDLRAELRRRFVVALARQERVTLLEENQRIAEETLSAVRELVRAGEVSPIEELKVDADLSIARADLEKATAELCIGRGALAALWRGQEGDYGPLLGALTIPRTLPEPEVVAGRLRDLPDLRRANAEIERREATVAVEKSLVRPDVTLSLGVRRFEASSDKALVAMVGLPLPIFDRRKGAIAAAFAERDRATFDRDAADVRLRNEAASALTRLRSAIADATRLQNDVLPKVQQVHASVDEGYRRGKFRLLDLLDARRSLTAAVLRFNDALQAVGLASADLFRLSGQPVDPTGESR